MIKSSDLIVLRAIAICFKQYLKPEEAEIYCNLGRTQLNLKLEQYGIRKNNSGYYKRADLDLMLSGQEPSIKNE